MLEPPVGALLVLTAALVLVGVTPARADQIADGRAAIETMGCVRCHQIPGIAPNVQSDCVHCHQELEKRPRSGLRRARVAQHYVRVPDLSRAGRRLRPDALIRYIQDPFDARPHLEESMPRLPVSDTQARAIVAYLESAAGQGPRSSRSSPAPSSARIERGRAIFARAGCPSCHVFGNVDFEAGVDEEFYRAMRDKALLAPNLRFVRERLDPATALAWIMDPTSVDPDTAMPAPDITRDEALAVRDFLFLAEPGTPVSPSSVPALSDVAPLDRRVRYAEVRRIFGRSCIHCHAKTTGMGATAGLGFQPLSLDLASRQGVLAGTTLQDGTRRSILRSPDGSTPPLVARLLRRYEEVPRDLQRIFRDPLLPGMRSDRDDAPVGMPLGLPPVPISDVRLLATWIAAGAPP